MTDLFHRAIEALRWYVNEDDVCESMPSNEPWVIGLNKARSILAEFDASHGAKSGQPRDYAANRIRDLEQTLDRARHCIKGLCSAKPVRDVDETLSEIDSVLSGAESGQEEVKDAARLEWLERACDHRMQKPYADVRIWIKDDERGRECFFHCYGSTGVGRIALRAAIDIAMREDITW